MTANEVKNLMKIYYDIPQMIAEEWAMREIENIVVGPRGRKSRTRQS